MMFQRPRTAIIGAGLSGLISAQQLSHSHQVCVFEKSRGYGGRMATRTRSPYQFDHGAQFLTATTAPFGDFLSELRAKEVAAVWTGRFGSWANDSFEPMANEAKADVRLVGTPKMTSIGRALTSGLEMSRQTEIKHLDRDTKGKLHLQDAKGNAYGPFDKVIVAVPHPQAMALITPLDHSFETATADVSMAPCFTLMLGLDDLPALPFDAVKLTDSDILGWMAIGRAGAPSLVVQSTTRWAKSHLDGDLGVVEEQLLEAVLEITSIAKSAIVHRDLHRWRYAFTEQPLGQPYWQSSQTPLYAIGDWCLGPKAEDAWLSATTLSDVITSSL